MLPKTVLIFLILVVAACGPRNRPPEIPVFSAGPAYGLPESSYTFSALATDPDGDSVALEVEWGDSTSSQWGSFVPSGMAAAWHHAWRTTGSFTVRCRARDIEGAVSDWSSGRAIRIVNPDSLPLPPSTPVGPDSTITGFIVEFSCAVNGPPGEPLAVDFDWGDSNILYGDSALAGGETLRARHAFEAPGSYHIRAQAWDVSDGRESDWSPEHVLEVKNTSGHGWERTHAARSARSVARAADGGFAMTGRSDSGLVLAKTDASGNLLWMRNYGDTIGPMGFSVRQTADGGYIVVSTTQGPWALNGVYLTRTDATGNPVWQRAYYEGEGEFPGPYGRCVRPTPDGGYVIAASELVMKTDSAGDSVWAKPHPGNAVELTPDGGYIICGGSNDGAHLIKTDALGNVQWDRIYSGEGLGFSAVQLTSDGGYMIAGSVVHQDGELAHLAKLDGAGVLIWERDFDGMGGAVGYDLALASDGGCYLVGTTYDADYTYYAYLVRTDRIGNTVWERVWCGSGEEDGGYAVIASPDGGCLVAGTRDDQAVLFKVDPQGGSGPTWFGRGHQPNAKKGVAFGGKMRDTHFRLPARPGMTR